GIEQIKFGDSKFTDLIKGFKDKNNRVFATACGRCGRAFLREYPPPEYRLKNQSPPRPYALRFYRVG
ncbi:MAG TPA: hypothetical protein PKM57_16475, partial [Kiritimatiellia bacterium]|nr:hypothetical protein [Kiritimatiellia bacterium]